MRVETITQKLGRDFAAVARRRSLCEDSGNDFGDDGRAEYEQAQADVLAHARRRERRFRFGPLRVLKRWARLRGFRADFIGGVLAPLQAYGAGCLSADLGCNDSGKWWACFARECDGPVKHIIGAEFDTRPEAVRFAGALLAVLS